MSVHASLLLIRIPIPETLLLTLIVADSVMRPLGPRMRPDPSISPCLRAVHARTFQHCVKDVRVLEAGI